MAISGVVTGVVPGIYSKHRHKRRQWPGQARP
jgi:hypothetical protein